MDTINFDTKKFTLPILFIIIYLFSCNEDKKRSFDNKSKNLNIKSFNAGSSHSYAFSQAESEIEEIAPEYDLYVNKKKFKFKNLPSGLNGVKIGVIADLHVKFMKPEYLQKVVNKFKNNKVDIIVFLGDLVNYDIKELCQSKIDILRQLIPLAKYGIYSILGNHDYGTFRFLSTKKAGEGYDKKWLKVIKTLDGNYLQIQM